MGRYFIIRCDEVIEEPDHERWSEWYRDVYPDVRRVAHTELQFGTVSTEFLAMSMSLSRAEWPLLFETRVKGGWLDGESRRYATFEEARNGHERWVDRVRSAEDENPPPGVGW